MNRSALRTAAILGPLLALAACASDQQRSVELLNRRLQTTLAPEIADNRVAVDALPDGARVTLLDAARLPDDEGALDNRERDPRASMVEGMLAPDIMRLSVADTGVATELQRKKRVDSFVQYLQAFRLGPTLQTAEVMPMNTVTDGPQGLAVTLRVECPDRTNWPGYGQGQSLPSCH
ncbi:MAG: hypothetical protein U1E70_22570 [Acetobacteraceae bacterium]